MSLAVALRSVLHLLLGGVRRVRGDGVGVALLEPRAALEPRRAVRRRDRADPVDVPHDARAHHQVRGQRPHREADALVPVRVVLAVVPAGEVHGGASPGELLAVLRLVEVAGAEPPQAVEAVEALGLPVVRPVGLHVHHRRPGARPVERAVLVVPVERDHLAGAEPLPGAVVPPGAVRVECRGHGKGHHSHADHHGGRDPRLALREPRQPQPRRHEHEQREPAEQRHAGVLLRHGGPVEQEQRHEAAAAEHAAFRSAPARTRAPPRSRAARGRRAGRSCGSTRRRRRRAS